MQPCFVELPFDGRSIRLEYAWVGTTDRRAPLVVFLHEGLGSLSMWKDWPQRLCAEGGYRGLVYSRYGYGRSTARPAGERWSPRFMHDQALDTLPRLREALGIGEPQTRPWLFGHSDGGSIALIHAACHPEGVAGVIAVAPHIRVEDVSIASIEQARDAYRSTDLRERLARYHADPDSAFWGWNDIWLDADFRAWSIEAMLPQLRCPVLAVQGEDDEYGTLAQVRDIRAAAPRTEVVEIPRCGHSPHRDQPELLLRVVTGFIARHELAVHNEGGRQ
jgi:pimeloyl-ACP methyl ester carboxylesterase